MILTYATIREQTCHHDFSFFFRELGCCCNLPLWTPWILGNLVHSGFLAGGMSTSAWSAATPNTTASITEFSYKGVSPTEAGLARIHVRHTPLKLNSEFTPEKLQDPNRKCHRLPTIHFQVRKAVSFWEGKTS